MESGSSRTTTGYSSGLSKLKSKDDNKLTWGNVLQLGLGRMQIPPQVFWQMSWGEFMLAAEGYFANQMEKFDSQRRLLVMIRNSNCHPNDQISPERFWPLPIDDTYEMYTGANQNLEPEHVERTLEQAAERIKKRPFLQKFLNQPDKK